MHSLQLFLLLVTTSFGIKPPDPPMKPVTFAPSDRIVYHKLGDKTIGIKLTQYGESIKNCCLNLHDNEVTAVKAARSVLEEQGGLLIKIENDARRNVSFTFRGSVYTFDPNRIFSRTGILLTLRSTGKINPLAVNEVEKFATMLLSLIPDSISCLVALHNNSDGDFSVKTYLPGGIRETDACQVYADEWQDIDDIALTTDETIYNKMSRFGYNSILQDNLKAFKDGSLSIYYGELNRRYINIETQHGKTVQYREMLKKLLYILDEEKRPDAGLAVATD
jgi:hypothetical protein